MIKTSRRKLQQIPLYDHSKGILILTIEGQENSCAFDSIKKFKELRPEWEFIINKPNIPGYLFISTNNEPSLLVIEILEESKKKAHPIIKNIIRIIPFEEIVYSSYKNIIESSKRILKPPPIEGKTFAIIVNKAGENSGLNRKEIIKKVATKILTNKYHINLKTPDSVLLIFLIGNSACIGWINKYTEYEKYNLVSIIKQALELKLKKSH